MDAKNSSPANNNCENSFSLDLKISWLLLKQNWKTLLSFGLFAIFGSYLIITLFTIFVMILLAEIFLAMHWEITIELFTDVAVIISIPQMILSFALYGCVYGLCYDIICSGDEFAEFKGAFTYFKKYWLQYVIISFIQGAISLLLSFYTTPDLTGEVPRFMPYGQFLLITGVGYIIGMIWYFAISITTPSITAHGSLKRAFKENFIVIRENKSRIIKVGLFYTFAVALPLWIMLMSSFYLALDYSGTMVIVIELIAIGIMIPVVLISNPLIALMLTRIYSTSSVFSQFQEEKKIQDAKIEIKPNF